MTGRLRALTLGACCLIALVTSALVANVNLMNGNFYIGFTDLIYGGGMAPRIERIYNSKTPYKGIFGWGWGTEYETYLHESIAGSVIIFQYGGGAENEYWPADIDAQVINDAIDAMVEARKAKLGSPAAAVAYRDSLNANGEYRRDEWRALVQAGAITQTRVTAGTRLAAVGSTDEQISKTADGYTRKLPDGTIETFGSDGRLARIDNGKGQFIVLTHDANGRLTSFADEKNRSITLSYNARGLVSKAAGSDGRTAEYRYGGRDDLIWSKDAAGDEHEYSYDDEHNLTKIEYPDDTRMEISYNRAFHDNVASVIERDGKRTDYTYEADPSRAGWLRVVERVTLEEDTTSTTYEYVARVKSSGQEWIEQIVQQTTWERKETTYNECCAMPLSIVRRSRNERDELGAPREIKFAYNDKGRLIEREDVSKGVVVRLTYHEGLDKIATVHRNENGDTMMTAYEYDAKANLTRAYNREHDVRLEYNAKNQIVRMTSADGELTFEYNDMGKPTLIKDPKLGHITVVYDAAGEIEKVDSGEGGQKMALAITQRFQNLLAVTRPPDMSVPCRDSKTCPRRGRPQRSGETLGQIPESAYMGASTRSKLIKP